MDLLQNKTYSLIWCGLKDPLIIFLLCRSLVDAVYALKDEVHELKKVSVLIISMDFIATNREVPTWSGSISIFLVLIGNRRTNGWSRSWRTSRSPVRSWRGSSGSWQSRRMTALLGTMVVAAAATDLLQVTAFVCPSSVQGCKGDLGSCLVYMSNVASSHSPAGLSSLTVRARLSVFVFLIQPSWHKILKMKLMKWAFSYFLLATATVTLLVGRGAKWLLRCFFHFSRTPARRRNL